MTRWIIVLGAVVLAFAAGCGGGSGDEAGGAAEGRWAEADAMMESELAAGTAEDARGWMEADGNAVFGDASTAAELIEALHEAGAERVLYFGIEELGGQRVTSSLAARLPKAAAKRKALFEVAAPYLEQFECDPVSDEGQTWIYFTVE